MNLHEKAEADGGMSAPSQEQAVLQRHAALCLPLLSPAHLLCHMLLSGRHCNFHAMFTSFEAFACVRESGKRSTDTESSEDETCLEVTTTACIHRRPSRLINGALFRIRSAPFPDRLSTAPICQERFDRDSFMRRWFTKGRIAP